MTVEAKDTNVRSIEDGGVGAAWAQTTDGESSIAPKPTHLNETGLSKWLLADLACKHLAEAGVLDIGEIAQRMALPGSVTEELLHFLREEGRVELRSRRDNNPLLRFGLTEAGRTTAQDALQKDGYVGPAPITLDSYEARSASQ